MSWMKKLQAELRKPLTKGDVLLLLLASLLGTWLRFLSS